MKKYILSLSVAFLAASNTFAGTYVTWYFGFGMFPYGETDLVNGPGVAATQNVLWQLLSAGINDTIDGLNLSNGGYVGGDDQVVFERTTLAGGDSLVGAWLWNEAAPPPDWSDSTYTGQTLFMRVFSSDTPSVGGYYWNSASTIEAVNYADTMIPAQSINGNSTAGMGEVLNIEIIAVPEPSTVALMLAGLAMVGYRRFRRA